MKKLFLISSLVAIVVGCILIVGGAWAVLFTYQRVSQENIVTPEDASIPNTPVRGPLTLKAQADAIRQHMLRLTGGKTYAQLPREDENRNLWVTATTLITALNVGMIAYLFSGLSILFGASLVWMGILLLF